MSNANDKNVVSKDVEFHNVNSNILSAITADGNMLMRTEGDIELEAAEIKNDAGGVCFGDLGDNYTGVPQTNSARNMGVMRLYSQTDGALCLDGRCNYYRVNYTTESVSAPGNVNVVQFPVRSWEATNAQTQQMPYVCDLFVRFANDGDSMSIQSVDNPIARSNVAASILFKGIENGGTHDINPNGVGGGSTLAVLSAGGVARSSCLFESTNGNTNQTLHLRISSYGSQLDVAQELLCECIALGSDDSNALSRFDATCA